MNTTTSGVESAISLQVTRRAGWPFSDRRFVPPAISTMSGTQCPPAKGRPDHPRPKAEHDLGGRGEQRDDLHGATGSLGRRDIRVTAGAIPGGTGSPGTAPGRA